MHGPHGGGNGGATGVLEAFAGLEVGQEAVAAFLLRFLEECTTAEHNVVAILVEFDDLGLHRLADVREQVAHAAQFDERCRQKAAQANVDDEPALDDFDDWALDGAVGLFDLLDRAPRTLVLRPLLAENEAAFLVFLGENQRFDRLAELDDLVGVDVVANAEFASRDDTFTLVADVQ